MSAYNWTTVIRLWSLLCMIFLVTNKFSFEQIVTEPIVDRLILVHMATRTGKLTSPFVQLLRLVDPQGAELSLVQGLTGWTRGEMHILQYTPSSSHQKWNAYWSQSIPKVCAMSLQAADLWPQQGLSGRTLLSQARSVNTGLLTLNL